MTNESVKPVTEKSLIRKIGETIGSIGHDLVEKKDSVLAASQTIVEKLTSPAKKDLNKPKMQKRDVGSADHKTNNKAITLIRRVSKKAAGLKMENAFREPEQ